MSSLGTVGQIQPQDLGTSSATQQTVVGSYAETPDGRGFRYVQAGGADLAPGRLVQASAQDTSNLQSLRLVAASANDTSITTSSSTTLAANQVAGGLVVVTRGAGMGIVSRVAGHPAVTSGTVTINLEDKLPVPLTTTSYVDLIPNPYGTVVINPTTSTSAAIGVSQNGTITASQYGWIQTHGPAALIVDGTVTIGQPIAGTSANTAGYAQLSGGTLEIIGYAITGIAGGDAGLVFLTID